MRNSINPCRSANDVFNNDFDERLQVLLPLQTSATIRYIDNERRKIICILNDDQIHYDYLTNQMNTFYNRKVRQIQCSQVKEGELCAIRIDKNWRRACVESHNPFCRTCRVRLYDEGYWCEFDYKDLFVLNPIFSTAHFSRYFGIFFVASDSGSQTLQKSGLTKGNEISYGNAVDIIVLSDTEPFLALFRKKTTVVKPESLVGGFDSDAARSWKANFVDISDERCEGVRNVCYAVSNLQCDNWLDVTIAAFDRLDNVYVRDLEQGARLFYLEQLMDKLYNDAQTRSQLLFEDGQSFTEGLVCVAKDNQNDRWVRGRILRISGDSTTIDAAAVDYPSLILKDLKICEHEVVMLKKELLFPSLCYSLRVIDYSDQIRLLMDSIILKPFLREGSHVRIRKPISSTLTALEFADGTKLNAILQKADQEKRNSNDANNFFKHNTNSVDNAFAKSMTLANCHLQTSAEMHQKKTKGLCNWNEIGIAKTYQPFSQSFSLDGPYIHPSSNASQSMESDHFKENCFTKPLFTEEMTNASYSSSTHPFSSSVNRHKLAGAPSRENQCVIERGSLSYYDNDGFLMPMPKKDHFSHPTTEKLDRKINFHCTNVNFETEFLNRTLTSYDSDTDNEICTKSSMNYAPSHNHLLQNKQFSPLQQHSDTYSGSDCDSLRDREISVYILNVNCTTEIYLETAETSFLSKRLREKLASIDRDSLIKVHSSWCGKNEVYLCSRPNSELERIKLMRRSNKSDRWLSICIDTGEELELPPDSTLYRLIPELNVERFLATCLGPFRLAGKFEREWMLVSSVQYLRSLCQRVDGITARICSDESYRAVFLYNHRKQSVNDMFASFINMNKRLSPKCAAL